MSAPNIFPPVATDAFDADWYAARYLHNARSGKAQDHYMTCGRDLGYAACFEEEAERCRLALEKRLAWELCRPEACRMRIAEYQRRRKELFGQARWVVYSAVSGNYDSVKIPLFLDGRVDYLLFSDTPQPETGVWQIRPLPYLEADLTRRTRYAKTHAPWLVPGYELAIWIDQNVLIVDDLSEEIEAFLQSERPLGTFYHPTRQTLASEACACLALAKDEKRLLTAQLARYQQLGIADFVPNTNVLFLRLDHPDLAPLLNAWWAEIACYSRRDQLSLAYALRVSGAQWQPLAQKGICTANHPKFGVLGHDKNRGLCHSLVCAQSTSLYDPLADSALLCGHKERQSLPSDLSVGILVFQKNTEPAPLPVTTMANVAVHIVRDSDIIAAFKPTPAQNLQVEKQRIFLDVCRKWQGSFVIVMDGDFVLDCEQLRKLLKTLSSHPRPAICAPLSNGLGLQSVPKALLAHEPLQAVSHTGATINELLKAWSLSELALPVPLLDSHFLVFSPGLGERLAESWARTGDFAHALFACEDQGIDLLLAFHSYVERLSEEQGDDSTSRDDARLVRARKTLLYHPLLQELRRRLQLVERLA